MRTHRGFVTCGDQANARYRIQENWETNESSNRTWITYFAVTQRIDWVNIDRDSSRMAKWSLNSFAQIFKFKCAKCRWPNSAERSAVNRFTHLMKLNSRQYSNAKRANEKEKKLYTFWHSIVWAAAAVAVERGLRTKFIIAERIRMSKLRSYIMELSVCEMKQKKKCGQLIVCVWKSKHLLGTRHTQQFSHEKAQTHTRFVSFEMTLRTWRCDTLLSWRTCYSQRHTT